MPGLFLYANALKREDTMADDDLESRIAILEAELQHLKRQRAPQQGRRLKALAGVRVVDLSRFIFGPFCTQMLGDMGAEVIKVEPRGSGDPARRAGQVFVQGESASFLARNRNKRSLALDFRQPRAHDILARLAERSDVLIHNFRPGVMARMGLDARQARSRNPQLIYCSLSGYGQSGPRAHWPGQDLLLQAMGGIISTTGWENGPPVAVGTYLADMAGALTAAFGIVTALQARSQYGIGQELEVSLLDAMFTLQAMETTTFLNSGTVPPKSGSGHWMSTQPYGVFDTADRPLALNATSEEWWGRLCQVPEFVHLRHDSRYNTRQARQAHGDALIQDLQAVLRTRSRDAWLAVLGQYDVLCAPVYDYAELFADPQVHHNGLVVEQSHPTAGRIKVIGVPVKLSETPGAVGPAAPRLGEHSQEILHWLGYTAADIAQLCQEQVVSVAGE
jgi:crotonobetainyl-CoA:carnitine CoA-transferase CaiB-like acyl-CoA transferase